MSFTIKIDSKEVEESLKQIVKQSPQAVNDFMKDIADEYKDGIKKACKEYDVRKSKLPKNVQKKDRKKVSTKWKEVPKATLTGCNVEIDVYNSHKLFHLLELGHAKYIRGKDTGGFVYGRHLEDKFQDKQEKHIQGKMEEFVNKYIDSKL